MVVYLMFMHYITFSGTGHQSITGFMSLVRSLKPTGPCSSHRITSELMFAQEEAEADSFLASSSTHLWA